MEKFSDDSFNAVVDILDNISEIIVYMDTNDTVLWANQAAMAAFPTLIKNDRSNYKCYELFFHCDTECSGCPVKRVISAKKSCSTVVCSYDDGIWRVSADPIFDENGNVVRIIKRVEDVKAATEIENRLHEMNTELERSNQDLEQFAYAVSHDLREPLRMIASYLQLIEIQNKDKFDTESKEFLSIAFDGAKRMNDLLDGLLQYSRVGSKGKIPVDCDFADIIRNATNNLMLQIDEAKAQIETCNMPKNIPADKSQLIQLFSNLIGNSIKYRKPETSPIIEISCCDDDKFWTFCVADNGIGIESQYYERIFQVFQRLHGRTEIPGYGLGLSICKRIVDRHGGKMWVDSEPGAGTSFYFTLPKKASIKNTIEQQLSKEEQQ